VTDTRLNIIRYRMERAEESLCAAELLGDAGHWNDFVNRLYYACFYAVSALLLTHGHSSSKHSGIRSLFMRHCIKTGLIPAELGKTYTRLFDCRQTSDYEDLFEAREEEVKPWLEEAKNLIEEIERQLPRKAQP